MEPYVKRLLIEYNIRLGNLNKLNNFIDSPTYLKLSNERKSDLKKRSNLETEILNLLRKNLSDAGVKRLVVEDFDFATALRLLKSGNLISSKSLKGYILKYNKGKITKRKSNLDSDEELWNPTQDQILAIDYFLIKN